MRMLKITVAVIFMLLLIVPVLLINTEPEVASMIDNRMLAPNPFSEEARSKEGADLTVDIENYLKDRIGFRDEMILANTVLNDRLFDKMEHPSYDYGKDGYVFFKYGQPGQMGDFQIAFADMVLAAQNYCNERGVPFLFVFDPEKKSVYSEYVRDGVNFDNRWVSQFLEELDKLKINYIDNTKILIEKKQEGEQVFNRKYNAGHWNDLGAFYGVNNILQNLSRFFPGIKMNSMEDFQVKPLLQTSLLVSQFPIDEEEPIFTYEGEFEDFTAIYNAETERHPSFRGFEYTVNEARKQEGSPKALVFQGSYMNGMGHKFLESSLGEYIAVHDYQNVLNLPYYFNLYQPECVVFEVAEYTFSSHYFDYETMINIAWNEPLEDYAAYKEKTESIDIAPEDLTVEPGEVFTKIKWSADSLYDHVWFYAEKDFDMALKDSEEKLYEVTVPNEYLENTEMEYYIVGGLNSDIVPVRIDPSVFAENS